MADSKISALTELATTPAAGDLLVLVDVSDTTMAASGTDKKITFTNLTGTFLSATGATTGATSQAQTFTNGVVSGGQVLGAAGTNAAPSFAFSGDPDTGFYSVGANRFAVAAAGTFVAEFQKGAGTQNLRLYGTAAASITTAQLIISDSQQFLSCQANDASGYAQIQSWKNGTGYNYPLNLQQNGGYVGIGVTVPTAVLHVAASSTTRASVCVVAGTAPTTPVVGDIWNDGALSFYNADATTNAIVNHLRLSRDSTGTAAAGLGLGILAELESTTTSRQSAGRLTWEWATATHASRAAKGKLTAYYTSTEREVITWVADSSSARVGIMQASPYTTLDVAGGVRISSFLTPSAGAGLELGYDGGNNRATITAYDRDASAYKTFLQNGLDYQFYISGSEKVRIDTGGNVGIGVSSPQSLIHGHDGSGGFLFVNRASVGGTLVTVIPDAAGDVTEKIFFVGWCTNSAPFSADVAPTTLAVSSSTTKTDGTNTLTIAVTAGGAFTLQATGGAATWNVNLWVFWR